MPVTGPPPGLMIRSGQGDYPVDFLDDFSALTVALATFPRAVILIDERIVELYRPMLMPLLDRVPWLAVPATEEEKSLAGVQRALAFFQQNNATKQTVLLAIGGGILQDIACFAAHLYYRGLRWVYVPTTLLAMCDSCIGAKCAVNFNGFKNQLGAFHSPHRVLIALPFLETLADTEIVSGYGEILKLLLTGSAAQFAELCTSVERDGLRGPQLARLIRESLQVKQGVIERDEYETDLRRILNYGHTFGHALEAVTQHAIPHGKAVAWGLDLVNFLAVERGLLARAEDAPIHAFVRKYFSHRLPAPVTAGALLEASRRDKKVANGKVNLIFLRTAGELAIVPTVYDATLERELARHLAERKILSWP